MFRNFVKSSVNNNAAAQEKTKAKINILKQSLMNKLDLHKEKPFRSTSIRAMNTNNMHDIWMENEVLRRKETKKIRKEIMKLN